jgi:hypothetical protein
MFDDLFSKNPKDTITKLRFVIDCDETINGIYISDDVLRAGLSSHFKELDECPLFSEYQHGPDLPSPNKIVGYITETTFSGREIYFSVRDFKIPDKLQNTPIDKIKVDVNLMGDIMEDGKGNKVLTSFKINYFFIIKKS